MEENDYEYCQNCEVALSWYLAKIARALHISKNLTA